MFNKKFPKKKYILPAVFAVMSLFIITSTVYSAATFFPEKNNQSQGKIVKNNSSKNIKSKQVANVSLGLPVGNLNNQNVSSPSLPASTISNSNYCTVLGEYNDLASAFPKEEAIKLLLRRYSNEILPTPNNTFFLNNFKNIGDSARDPVLGFQHKLISTSVKQINSERNHFSADNKYFFIRTGTSNWAIFDSNNGGLVKTVNLSVGGVNPTDAVYWHPSQSNVLFYPINNTIYYYNIENDQSQVALTSPFGNIGSGNRQLAGGDGNYPNKNGLFLITHGSKNTKAQVINLNTGKVAVTKFNKNTLLGYETVEIPWDNTSPVFDFPADLDYATLSADGNFIVAAIEGEGTIVYDLSGRKVGQLYGDSAHMSSAYVYKSNRENNQSVIFKLNSGQSSQRPGSRPGDMIAVDFYVSLDSEGKYILNKSESTLLSWVGQAGNNLSGPAGGGQQSSFSLNRYTSILALNPSIAVKVSGHDTYYNEIIELYTRFDDFSPRRIVQHLIDTNSPVEDQPEAWLSPDGSKMIWKSDLKGALPGTGYLFMTEIPLRTCSSARIDFANGILPPKIITPPPTPDPITDPKPNPGPVLTDSAILKEFLNRGSGRYYISWEAPKVTTKSIINYNILINGSSIARQKSTNRSFRMTSGKSYCAVIQTNFSDSSKSLSNEICVN